MTLGQWMTRAPQVVEPNVSALDALERMSQGGFRHLPVLDENAGLIGIVSIDDLRAVLPFDVGVDTPLLEESRDIARRYRVDEVMTYLPVSARPETPLDQAVRELMERRIGCLPVCDASGELVGIFTETDALRALLALRARERGQAPADEPDAKSERTLQIAQLAAELRMERDRIYAALARKERACSRVAGDSSHGYATGSSPIAEGAEAATGSSALEGALGAFALRRLRDIGCALYRHEHGTFGVCVSCGSDIPVARLQAQPSAQRCTRCAPSAARANDGATRPAVTERPDSSRR